MAVPPHPPSSQETHQAETRLGDRRSTAYALAFSFALLGFSGVVCPWTWLAGAVQALWAHIATTVVILGLYARTRATLAMAGIAILSMGAFWHRPPLDSDSANLVVVAWNAHGSSRDSTEAIAGLRATQADIVVVTELTPHWERELSKLGYSFEALSPGRGAHGTGIYSQWPLRDIEILQQWQDWPRQTVLATVAHPVRDVRVAGVHTPSPLSPERPARLVQMARPLQEADIVAGDFNTTPWMSLFEPLLSDRRSAGGCEPTWPAPARWLGLPIDHILVSPQIGVADFAVGETWGSDHHAITAKLLVKPDPG